MIRQPHGIHMQLEPRWMNNQRAAFDFRSTRSTRATSPAFNCPNPWFTDSEPVPDTSAEECRSLCLEDIHKQAMETVADITADALRYAANRPE